MEAQPPKPKPTPKQPPPLVIREEPAAPDAGGLVAALRELLEPNDRRLQASVFLLACGSSVVLHGTMVNLADNPEHVLAGYGLVMIGAALVYLTLNGSGAAAGVEEALRGFFN